MNPQFDQTRRFPRRTRIARRSLLALFAGTMSTIVAACTGGSRPDPVPNNSATSAGPSPKAVTPSTSPSAAVTATTKGITGDLAELARALYTGKDITTSAATTALKSRRPPAASEVTITGSEGNWHGTRIGVLSQGKDLTFVVRHDDTWTVVAGRWPDLGVDRLCAGDKQFVLVIGSDAREADGESITRSRGDTLQIIGVDGAGSAGIVGIPRDSWTSAGKINSAMVFGGPTGQVDAIAKLTGLPIKHYVLTGFDGFSGFVDALGGVTVDNPHAMPSRGIPKGTVQLDRKKALWFARERHSLSDGDFGRAADQQRLLVAFALAMKTLGPARFGSLVTTLSRLTKTSLPAESALQYAAWAWSIKPSKLARVVATGDFGTRSGQSVVLLGPPAESIFRDFADGNLTQG